MSKISLTKFKYIKGFTLVELIVSIAIMTVILTVVVTGQTNYTSGSSLSQAADDISLSLRQAQVYGISVNKLSGSFDTGYGIEFRTDSNGSKNAYILFADRVKSGLYNYTYDGTWNCDINDLNQTTGECLQKTIFSNGNIIKELCYIPVSGSEGSPCSNPVNRADITFLRPNTDAHIILNGNSDPTVKGVRIRLQAIDNSTISVVVYTTGQISVSRP